MSFFTNLSCIAQACFEKYTYDAWHDLYIFVHVVSEVVTLEYSIKKMFLLKFSKEFRNFKGIWRIYLVSPSKNHKFPEKTWYFKTLTRQRINFNSMQVLQFDKYYNFVQVHHVSYPKIACFHRVSLKVIRNFWAPSHPISLNVWKVTTEKHLCRSLFFW